MKYTKPFWDSFKEKEIISTRDIKKFLTEKKAPKTYTSTFIKILLKNKKIFKLRHGYYSTKNRTDFLEKTTLPSYHGLQEALSIHKLWTQQTATILITPRKIRTGERGSEGNKIIIRRISRKMFFGYETIKYLDEWITVSDKEKTLIDFVHYNEPLDEETKKELIKSINKEKLKDYLEKTNKIFRKKFSKRFALYD